MDQDTYIANHIDPEGDYLYQLYRATNIHTLHGRMASGHLQGRLLKMLVHMTQAKRVLEVGTFSGYSAICLAQGLPDDGLLYTFEINDEQEDFTRPWIENSDVASKIHFIIGDAITQAPQLGVSALMWKPTKWRSPCCDKGALSWLITRCGMVMCSIRPTIKTNKHWAYADLTTSWLPTHALKK